jgi:hypothetical protein
MTLRRLDRGLPKLILYGCGGFIDDYEGISGYEEYRDDLRLLYFALGGRGRWGGAGYQAWQLVRYAVTTTGWRSRSTRPARSTCSTRSSAPSTGWHRFASTAAALATSTLDGPISRLGVDYLYSLVAFGRSEMYVSQRKAQQFLDATTGERERTLRGREVGAIYGRTPLLDAAGE